MPFTFAHPAIVLPLRKCKWFSFSALVFGSMAPDFEYFFRMQPFSVYSHTMLGLWLVDLPIAVLLAFLYQYVVKKQMLARCQSGLDEGWVTQTTEAECQRGERQLCLCTPRYSAV